MVFHYFLLVILLFFPSNYILFMFSAWNQFSCQYYWSYCIVSFKIEFNHMHPQFLAAVLSIYSDLKMLFFWSWKEQKMRQFSHSKAETWFQPVLAPPPPKKRSLLAFYQSYSPVNFWDFLCVSVRVLFWCSASMVTTPASGLEINLYEKLLAYLYRANSVLLQFILC